MLSQEIWNGRFDGQTQEHQRLFQKIILTNHFHEIKKNDFVLQGFAVDEGVKRNQGKIGAKNAPNIIRKNMSNFPVWNQNQNFFDIGNIYCIDENLENSQKEFAQNVYQILEKEAQSIAIGGGHEITYAHYLGIRQKFKTEKIGIVNFDAHFDNREPVNQQATSGTGFWQIFSQDENVNSLHIGIQKNSNTPKLFQTAEKFSMEYILADEIYFENLTFLKQKINEFLNKIDILYITICMDVFNASIAPGVSALAYNGIFADQSFKTLYHLLLKNHKLKALDIAEVNPLYDTNEMTARLAAALLNEYLMI